MRSLKYLPALLPFVSIGAYAEPDKDVWVVVTQTNTVTVCPITEWLTCNNDISTSLLTNTRSSHATTTSGNGSNGGNNTSTSHGGQGPSSTSHITTTITTTASHDGQGGPGSSSTSSGSSSTSTSQGGKGSSSTTSATSSTSLTGPYDGTTSTSTTSQGPYDGTTSSTTSQGPYDSTTSTTTSSNGGYSNGTTTSQSLTSSTSTSSYNGFLNGTTTTQTSTSTTSGAEASTTSTTTQTLTSTSTTSGLGYNGTTTTSSSASSLTTTSFYGNVSVTTTTSLYGNNSSSTTSTLSTTTSIYGNASITTTGLSTTTTPINGTTTSFFGNITSTTTSFATTTTPVNSTSTCNNATHTATSLPETSCNDANSRSTWCGEKKVSDDTDVLYYSSQTKTFDLTITNTTADFDGINYFDFAINGQTPGPLIELNWGDIAIVTVHNQLQNNATTIHWHGVRQLGTNDQDGVPGVTECGIAPGSSRTYTFHASTYGTGWYHGHAMAQFGGGVRGPMIIHGPATANYDLDLGTIMIDDVYDSPMMEVAARAARTAGPPPVAVNYLLNGKNLSPDGTEGETPKWILKEGKKHLFRIINSSAQGSYIVHLDGHNFTVISADYTPIVPYVTDYLYILTIANIDRKRRAGEGVIWCDTA